MRKTIIPLFVLIIYLLLSGCTGNTEKQLEQSKDSEVEVEEVVMDEEQSNGLHFFVPSENDNLISIIDLPSHQVVNSIDVGERPANMVFMKDKDKGFVTHRNGDSVGVIDLNTNQMTKEIKVGIDPHGIALSENEEDVYVTTVEDQYIYIIDTETEEVSKTIDLGTSAKTNYPVLHNEYLYVTDHENHLVYAIKNDQLIDTYKVGGPPMVARTNKDGSLLYVASSSYGSLEVFDTDTGNKVKDIQSGDGVTDFVINEEETHLVATNMAEDSVSIIDLATDEILAKIDSLPAPKHISFNEKESKVYFSLSDTNKIGSIDMETKKLTDEIEVGGKPHGVHLWEY